MSTRKSNKQSRQRQEALSDIRQDDNYAVILVCSNQLGPRTYARWGLTLDEIGIGIEIEIGVDIGGIFIQILIIPSISIRAQSKSIAIKSSKWHDVNPYPR